MMCVFLFARRQTPLLAPTRTTHIGSEHDRVLRIASELGLVQTRRKQLDVRTTAVNVLLVLGGELQNQVLVLIVEHIVHLRRVAIETSILRSLDSLILGVAVPLSSRPRPLTHLLGLLPAGRLHPAILVTYTSRTCTDCNPHRTSLGSRPQP